MSDEMTTPSSVPLAPFELAPRPPENPHRTLGIVGFVFSFFALLNIAGLILCIVALVKSKRAGYRNGLALAGVFIAGLGVVVTIVVVAVAASALVDAAQTCARLGDGVHVIGNSVYTCTPTSFNVNTRL